MPWDSMLWRVFISTVCALLCTLVALVAAPSTRRKTCEILAFLFGVPAFSLFIAFDLWAPSWNPLVGFPRNGSELMADPVAVMRLLKADGAVPQGAELVGLVTDGVLSAEPAKNAQISRLRLTYSSLSGGGPPVVLRLFVKYQAERGTTLLARALAAVYSPMHTEVGFYTRIVPALAAAPGSPRVPAPRCLAARYSRAFGRVLTVLETLGDEYEATPDWKGVPAGHLRAMLRGIAPLHATFWGPRAGAQEGSAAAFLYPSDGKLWIDGLVRLFLSPATDPPWLAPVWDGICRWLAPLPVCLSHGDFRPGNMLFRRRAAAAAAAGSDGCDAEAEAEEEKEAEVVLTDWEALAVTPFLWDYTYATTLGMSPAARRDAHPALLALYLDELAAALRAAGDAAAAEALPPLAVCESAVTALSLVIFYFGWVLGKMGGIGGPQGNSDADCTAWQERGAAILERTEGAAAPAVAAALGVDVRVVEDMRRHF